MIHFLPIEPLEERYSAQWTKWFHREFCESPKIGPGGFLTWNGTPVAQEVRSGQFLDVTGTHAWKFSQLEQLFRADALRDGDVVFLMDAWFPGLEALAYWRQGKGIDFKIMGILHDGTYNPADFLAQRGMATWGKWIEAGWFEILDKIFVATQYHKNFLLNVRPVRPEKVIVTGLPIYPDECLAPPPRDNLPPKRPFHVIFPHRLAPEKAPEKFDHLLDLNGYIGCRRSAGERWTKSRYYEMMSLSEVAVSYATQEMFGIAMLEACANGCLPLVPDRLSYSEIYPADFKYQPEEEANLGPRIDKLIREREKYEPMARAIPWHFRNAIPNMIAEMQPC